MSDERAKRRDVDALAGIEAGLDGPQEGARFGERRRLRLDRRELRGDQPAKIDLPVAMQPQ